MTQEEKQLLLVDLCARLPYGVKIRIEYPFVKEKYWHPEDLCGLDLRRQVIADTSIRIEEFKPYLRPMSSMTEEERLELSRLSDDKFKFYLYTGEPEIICYEKYNYLEGVKVFNWFNKKHFDYRGLIEKGLAIEAPKEMYK